MSYTPDPPHPPMSYMYTPGIMKVVDKTRSPPLCLVNMEAAPGQQGGGFSTNYGLKKRRLSNITNSLPEDTSCTGTCARRRRSCDGGGDGGPGDPRRPCQTSEQKVVFVLIADSVDVKKDR